MGASNCDDVAKRYAGSGWPSIIMMFAADYCVQGNRLVEEILGQQFVMERVP